MPGKFSPYLVVTPLVTLMFTFYGRVTPFGALGYVGGALAGFAWSLVAGAVSSWLSQDCTIGSRVLVSCFFNSTLGTRKTIPTSSTPTRRRLDTVSCCGSR